MTRRRVGNRAKLVCADLNEPLDFIGDDSTDLVISSLALHYLKDWTLVMREFHRILKPGGFLVFSVHHPFMDYTVFQRENYFLTELLEDDWDVNHVKVKVQFYRRPLNAIMSAVLHAGFILEELLEPMPTEEFKQALPQSYEKLLRKPQFLFIRARKASEY